MSSSTMLSSTEKTAPWPLPEHVDTQRGEKSSLYLLEAKLCNDLQLQELHNISTLSSYHIVKENNQAFYLF